VDTSSRTVSELQQAKQALRRQLTALREQIDPEQAAAWAAAIGRHLLGSELLASLVLDRQDHTVPAEQAKPGIGLFIAMRREVDFQPFWQPLRARGLSLCFPRMIRADGRTDLEFLAIPGQADPHAHLVLSRFGVREPAPASAENGLSPCDPALILLPGLGFDPRGNRLGWGQGYYDHYLARRLARPRQDPSSRPLLIGVAYPFQILDRIPAGDQDIPVDYLLSPAGLVQTSGTSIPGGIP